MILEKIIVGELQVNCYILADDKNAVIIDPGDEPEKIKRILKRFKLIPSLIINTHGHIDHIAADAAFGVPVYIHREDFPFLTEPRLNLSEFLGSEFILDSNVKVCCLEDSQFIRVDGLELEILHTPGHTPGGISILLRKPQRNILFTGDTLFAGSIGRTDFLGADQKVLLESIRNKILILDDKVKIFPGHGPDTFVGKEKYDNPFLNG